MRDDHHLSRLIEETRVSLLDAKHLPFDQKHEFTGCFGGADDFLDTQALVKAGFLAVSNALVGFTAQPLRRTRRRFAALLAARFRREGGGRARVIIVLLLLLFLPLVDEQLRIELASSLEILHQLLAFQVLLRFLCGD